MLALEWVCDRINNCRVDISVLLACQGFQSNEKLQKGAQGLITTDRAGYT